MAAKIRLTRRVSFSSGHRYWLPGISEEENKRLFGAWASPYNHGHNYVLDVTTEGAPDERTGMVVNIKTIDDLLDEHIVSQFDGKSINDEVEHFQQEPPTLENLLIYIKSELTMLPREAELVALRLEEMPTLWAETNKKSNWKMTLTKSYEFCAAHRLQSDLMSPEENERLYGKCMNPAGHGHNYILEVTVSGEVDPASGTIVDLTKLDEAVNRLVVDRFDHKNLNLDIPEFQGKITSTEIVVQQIFDSLNGHLPAKLDRVRLYETARSSFEVSSE